MKQAYMPDMVLFTNIKIKIHIKNLYSVSLFYFFIFFLFEFDIFILAKTLPLGLDAPVPPKPKQYMGMTLAKKNKPSMKSIFLGGTSPKKASGEGMVRNILFLPDINMIMLNSI